MHQHRPIDMTSLEPDVLSYIANLRRESAKYRIRAKQLQEELASLRAERGAE